MEFGMVDVLRPEFLEFQGWLQTCLIFWKGKMEVLTSAHPVGVELRNNFLNFLGQLQNMSFGKHLTSWKSWRGYTLWKWSCGKHLTS